MKKIWMMTAALGLGIWLTGCSPAFVPVEDPSESQTEERNSPETEKEDQREDLAFQPISEEERRRIVTELESFDGDHKFSDMDPERQHPAAERSGMRMILSDGRRKMVTGMSCDFEKARRIRCKISAFTALMM